MSENNKRYVRGGSVDITVQFKDGNEVVVTPTSASLRLAYKHNAVDVITTVALVDAGGGNWTYEWASDPADFGPVYWWAQSGDPPKSAVQGSFLIEANAAALQT